MTDERNPDDEVEQTEAPADSPELDREADKSLPGGSYSGGAATEDEGAIDGSGDPDVDPSVS